MSAADRRQLMKTEAADKPLLIPTAWQRSAEPEFPLAQGAAAGIAQSGTKTHGATSRSPVAPEEDAVRHLYNPHRREWVQDRVRVRIETEAFDQGAMRQCFRSCRGLSRMDNWTTSACNYVAKKYIEEVDNSVYFEDVRLQMNAKLWAQEYNRHQPPKKVDIMQMSVIEFINRPGAPMYHLEHYIEGEYIKYNSNSGFVDEKLRQTPHALSHFTFERQRSRRSSWWTFKELTISTPIRRSHGWRHRIRRRQSGRPRHGAVLSVAHLQRHLPADGPVATSAETCIRADIFTIGSPPPIASPVSNSVFDSGCSTDEDHSQLAAPQLGLRWRRRRNTSGELTAWRCWPAAGVSSRSFSSSCPGARSRSDSGEEQRQLLWRGLLQRLLPARLPEVRVVGPILGRVHHELISAELGVVEAAANLARLHLGMPADCLQDMPRDLL
uniref:Alpha-type protein kinase domain-containing protein n=1 Tax=Macrostomum lignano TaxID=282301 RepID=A0A1I8FAK8_9PLAT